MVSGELSEMHGSRILAHATACTAGAGANHILVGNPQIAGSLGGLTLLTAGVGIWWKKRTDTSTS